MPREGLSVRPARLALTEFIENLDAILNQPRLTTDNSETNRSTWVAEARAARHAALQALYALNAVEPPPLAPPVLPTDKLATIRELVSQVALGLPEYATRLIAAFIAQVETFDFAGASGVQRELRQLLAEAGLLNSQPHHRLRPPPQFRSRCLPVVAGGCQLNDIIPCVCRRGQPQLRRHHGIHLHRRHGPQPR